MSAERVEKICWDRYYTEDRGAPTTILLLPADMSQERSFWIGRATGPTARMMALEEAARNFPTRPCRYRPIMEFGRRWAVVVVDTRSR